MMLTATPRRVQIGIVLAGYAGVFAVSALWVTTRYLAELRDPDMFNSGMAAGGDWFLELIIVGMFFVPTFLLALVIRNSESASTKFAKILFGFALALPVCGVLMAVPAIGQGKSLVGAIIGNVCLYRVFAFPMTVFGLAGCCLLAKFKRPRRLILYSVGIEIGSSILLFALTTIH